MKRYSLFIGLFLSFFMIFLVGCDKKNDNKDDDVVEVGEEGIIIPTQSSYNLYVGEEYNPFHNQNSDYSFKLENTDVATIDEAGKIKAVNEGTAYLTLLKNNEIVKSYEIYVTKKEKVNYKYDEDEYNNLKEKLDFSSYYQYGITVNTYIGDFSDGTSASVETKMMMKRDPFYAETKIIASGLSSHTLIKGTSGDKYISYTIDDAKKTYKSAYLTSTEFNGKEYIDQNTDFISDFDTIDKSKVELTCLGENSYMLKVALSDYLSLYDDILKDNFSSYYDKIKDTVITTMFRFGERSYINTNGTLHFMENGKLFHCPFSVTIDISQYFSDHFYFTGYTDLSAGDILTVDDIFTPDNNGNKTLKVKLQKGRYAIEDLESISNTRVIMFTVKDSSGNLITNNNIDADLVKNIINIEKEDIYTIDFRAGVYGAATNTYKFVKINYPEREASSLQNSSGTLEGLYDYKKFTYSSTNENEVIKLTNNSNNKLYLYVENCITGSSAYGYNSITVDGKKTIYINPDTNTAIYVISAINEYNYDKDYQYDYDFTVESIINANGSDYENLDEVSTEFGKEYMVGYTYAPRKLLLKAEKKGLYSFSFKGLDSYSHAQVYVDDGGRHYAQSGPKFKLEAGEYVIALLTNDHLFDICSLKYEYFDTSDRDVDIELTVTDKISLGNVLNLKVIDEQIVRYHFNLAESSIVAYEKEHVYIYDSEGKKVSTNNSSFGYNFIKLKAGSYYAIYTGYAPIVSGEYEHHKTFTLFVSESTLDHYFDPDDIPDVEFDKEYIFTGSNSVYNFLCFKYVAVKDKTIRLYSNSVNIEIYDEDLNSVNTYKMVEGKTYYFIIRVNGGYSTPSIRFVLE